MTAVASLKRYRVVSLVLALAMTIMPALTAGAAEAALISDPGVGPAVARCADGLYEAAFSLDGVDIMACVPFKADEVSATTPDQPVQSAAVIRWKPFANFSVYAMPFGVRPVDGDLPSAEAGGAEGYLERMAAGHNEMVASPVIQVFGKPVEGRAWRLGESERQASLGAEIAAAWTVEAGGRVWIISALGAQSDGVVESALGGLSRMTVSSPRVDRPSTSVAALSAAPPAAKAAAAPEATDLPFPAWWDGNCNVGNHPGSYPLGSSYRGVVTCGPRGSERAVLFFPGAYQQLEWQSPEHSKRYLYLAYGVPPYSAAGSQVVWNYPEDNLEKVSNGTPHKAPQPGSVLSYNIAGVSYGHTSVVSATNIDANGNGTINVVEQNHSTTGVATHTISNWTVSATGMTVSGWLLEACPTVSTAVTPAGAGAVTIAPAPNCGSGYNPGTVVTATATANTGYTFNAWSGSLVSAANPVTMTVDVAKSLTARFDPLCYPLTKTATPSYGGTVSASPAPNCPSSAGLYTYGTQVTLTATPATNYRFTNWSGAATGTASPTTVTVTGATDVNANFAEICYTLSTAVSPASAGGVGVSPAPNCGGGSGYTPGTTVTLSAAANAGFSFANWSGSLTGTVSPATLVMNGNKSVSANFNYTCYALTTTANPAAGGTIGKSPAPNCPSDPAKYLYGTVVQLTATPSTGYRFTGWSGDATGTTSPASVTMTVDRTATASFEVLCYPLTTTATPAIGGTVAASPAPNCPHTAGQYAYGTQVSVTATPSTYYQFSSWSGGATGTTNPAVVTLTAATTVNANFAEVCYSLSTTVAPSGGGTVTVSPAPNCSTGSGYHLGTTVTLSAAANAGFSFANWSGSLTGTVSPATLVMNGNKSVSANFNYTCYALTTTANPAAGGTIGKSPAPNCPSDPAKYLYGTVVQLTATPSTGYRFTGWSGDATGTTSPASVTMTVDRTATASFEVLCFPLTTTATPAIGGTVAASPAPNCPHTAGQYAYGTQVTLSAIAGSAYQFTGWSGGITGTSTPVVVVMTAATTVNANFAEVCYSLSSSVSPVGAGAVAISPAPNCSTGSGYHPGTSVVLTATANSGYTFANWSGSLTGTTNPATLVMNGNKSVSANYEAACYTLSLTASPATGGTVSRDPAPNCPTNPSKYLFNTRVKLTASANTGFQFTNWSGDAAGPANPTYITMSADRSVTAVFDYICYSFTGLASPAGTGSAQSLTAANCGTAGYRYGTAIQVIGNAATGYEFDRWTGTVASTANPVTITMTSPVTQTANFIPSCHTVTTRVVPGGAGTVTASPAPNCRDGVRYQYNTVVNFTAAPAAGYAFTNWSDTTTGATNPVSVTVQSAITATANFTLTCHTVTTGVEPAGVGTVQVVTPPNCANGQYRYGTPVQALASPTAGLNYEFANWAGATTSTSNPVTVTLQGNTHFTGTFRLACYPVSLSVDPAGSGTATVQPPPTCWDGQRYAHGTWIQLNATPGTGYAFTGWTGTIVHPNTPFYFQVTSPVAATANFTATCHTLALTATPPEGGSVTTSPAPNCAAGQYRYGTSVQLTAAPAAGFAFGGWSGAVSGTTSPVNVLIDANKAVTATFPATLWLDVAPAQKTVTVGDIFTIELRSLTGAQPVDTAHLVVQYDPASLQVVDAAGNPATQVIPGAALPVVLTNTVNTTTGIITYAAGTLNPQAPSGTTTIAYLRLRAVGSGTSQITYLAGSELVFGGQVLGGARLGGTVTAVPVALQGIVTLEGRGTRGDLRWLGYPLTVEFGSGTCISPTVTHQATTDQNGRFIVPDFVTGVFSVRTKNPHSLSTCRTGVTIPTAGEVDLGLMLEGDVNNDDCVSAVDFSLFRTSYLLCKQDTGFDARSDFNGDGCVTTADFSLLAKNYLVCGPITVTAVERTNSTAAGSVVLSISPSASTAAPGQEFTVDLAVAAGAQEVQGVDAVVTYDPLYLEVLEVTAGPQLETPLLSEFNNTTGVLSYNAGHLGAPAPTGNFTLATVKFRMKALPAAPLSVAYTTGTDALYAGESVLGGTQPGNVLADPAWAVRSRLPVVMK